DAAHRTTATMRTTISTTAMPASGWRRWRRADPQVRGAVPPPAGGRAPGGRGAAVVAGGAAGAGPGGAGRAASRGPGRGPAGGGPSGEAAGSAGRRARRSEHDDETTSPGGGMEVALEEQGAVAREFLGGLVERMNLVAEVGLSIPDDETVELNLQGPDLGLLI